MRERHQRPRVQDCGAKWRICYWDYRSRKRSGRTKSWAKSLVPTRTEAQRLADGFMETVNTRNNEPQLFPGGEETLAGLVAILSVSLAGQAVGVKEVDHGIWLVSFMEYDLGYIDLEEKTLQPLQNPFGPKV